MKQILKLAEKLIAIPSTSDNPTALKETLELVKLELEGSKLKEFNKDGVLSLLYFNTKSLPKKFRLILNAHLDVVPANDSQFKPEQRNGKLFGRGADDMKTAAAAIIILFKDIATKLQYPLGLQIVTDEEVGGFNGTKYQIDQGIKADFVISSENTNLEINHKSKGILWLKIKTKGISAHGAYPWQGINAIWKMQKILNILENLYPIPNEEIWCNTANLANIESANKTFNKVPDECIAYLDIRYIPEDKDKILEELKQQFGQDVNLEIVTNEPAHLTDESNKYLQKLSQAIKKVLNQEAELVNKHGASDIRHYNKVGIEGVTFGPSGGGYHSDNEWVDIKSVEKYYQILEKFLLDINRIV